MKKAFVIGSPIEHSLSPDIFSFLAETLKQNLIYEKKYLEPKDFLDFKKVMQSQGALGCNVTYPLKEIVVQDAQNMSESVQFLQAANVIHFEESRSKTGESYYYNTDWSAFSKSLPRQFNSAALFGFGSTTRSVLYGLCQNKTPNVFIKVRSAKSETLDWLEKFRERFSDTRISLVPTTPDVEMVVNTLPRQAIPADDFFDFKDQKNLLVYDINYGDPAFLNRYHQVQKKDGLSMLIYQALETWGLWFEPLENEHKNNLHQNLYNKLSEKLNEKISEKISKGCS